MIDHWLPRNKSSKKHSIFHGSCFKDLSWQIRYRSSTRPLGSHQPSIMHEFHKAVADGWTSEESNHSFRGQVTNQSWKTQKIEMAVTKDLTSSSKFSGSCGLTFQTALQSSINLLSSKLVWKCWHDKTAGNTCRDASRAIPRIDSKEEFCVLGSSGIADMKNDRNEIKGLNFLSYFSFMSLIFWCFISFSTKTGINQWRVYPWIQGFAFVFYHLFYIDFEANPWFTGNLFMIHSSRPQKGIEISGLVNVHWFHSTAGLFVSIFNLFDLLLNDYWFLFFPWIAFSFGLKNASRKETGIQQRNQGILLSYFWSISSINSKALVSM